MSWEVPTSPTTSPSEKRGETRARRRSSSPGQEFDPLGFPGLDHALDHRRPLLEQLLRDQLRQESALELVGRLVAQIPGGGLVGDEHSPLEVLDEERIVELVGRVLEPPQPTVGASRSPPLTNDEDDTPRQQRQSDGNGGVRAPDSVSVENGVQRRHHGQAEGRDYPGGRRGDSQQRQHLAYDRIVSGRQREARPVRESDRVTLPDSRTADAACSGTRPTP